MEQNMTRKNPELFCDVPGKDALATALVILYEFDRVMLYGDAKSVEKHRAYAYKWQMIVDALVAAK